ncbi:MAG: VOC family protein [Candidatus Poribacteria bacterium]|nr:VOC family protein [Candidatus Poribacteria bacterium]
MKSELYTMLIPILKVKDLDAEVAFYRSLGFELSYNGEDFKAIKYADCIEFGLGRKADVNVEDVLRHFTWQIAVNSVQEVLDRCCEKNLEVVQDLKKYTYDFGDVYTITVKSPNGYDVVFEGDL